MEENIYTNFGVGRTLENLECAFDKVQSKQD